jgi:hypothetical protein
MVTKGIVFFATLLPLEIRLFVLLAFFFLHPQAMLNSASNLIKILAVQ